MSSANAASVLLVEDDAAARSAVGKSLAAHGYEVRFAEDGEEALRLWEQRRPDIVLLDLGLPTMDGLTVLRRIRRDGTTPVVILSAHDAERRKVAALDAGADDYLTKPFSFEELAARVRALLRRQQRIAAAGGPGGRLLQVGDLTLEEPSREVRRGERLIELTATEYNLLHLFMTNPRQVLDRQTILTRVWGYDFMGETNIIEVYVRYLREKIEDEPSAPRFIQTVRGIGYVLKG